jgi:hypothetical protein
MDTQTAKGKLPAIRSHLQARQGAWGSPPLLAIHRRNDGAHPIRAGLADGLMGERHLPHHGVSWEQERSLTGDATAIRCTGAFTPLPPICVMQIRLTAWGLGMCQRREGCNGRAQRLPCQDIR